VETDWFHVSPVCQGVDPDPFYSLISEALNQGKKVRDVAVHIAVRYQAEQVERASTLSDQIYHLFPNPALEQGAAVDGTIDQFCPLLKHSPGTKCVVPYLRITHVVVRRQSHRRPVGLELEKYRRLLEQAV